MQIEPKEVLVINGGIIGAIVILLAISNIADGNNITQTIQQLTDKKGIGETLDYINLVRQFYFSGHALGAIMIIPFSLSAVMEIKGMIKGEKFEENNKPLNYHKKALNLMRNGFALIIAMSLVGLGLHVAEFYNAMLILFN